MRVIANNLPETKVTCQQCRSELAYTADDVEARGEDYFGDWHYHRYIKCPICKHKIILEVDGVKMI